MQMGPRAEACAADSTYHFALPHPLPLLHIDLRQMAIQRAATRLGVLQLHRNAVAPRQTTAGHRA